MIDSCFILEEQILECQSPMVGVVFCMALGSTNGFHVTVDLEIGLVHPTLHVTVPVANTNTPDVTVLVVYTNIPDVTVPGANSEIPDVAAANRLGCIP